MNEFVEKPKMRTLDGHIIDKTRDTLKITVMDGPGTGIGGANHLYRIEGFNTSTNVSHNGGEDGTDHYSACDILFQNGTIPEVGVNGVTELSLLEIVADRLRSFQAGPFSCKENAIALTHIEEAQNSLNRRTIARMRRGVEGKHVA